MQYCKPFAFHSLQVMGLYFSLLSFITLLPALFITHLLYKNYYNKINNIRYELSSLDLSSFISLLKLSVPQPFISYPPSFHLPASACFYFL